MTGTTEPNHVPYWSDETIQKLTDLWNQGLSARKIAIEMGDGTTRNSVIGKARRLGLSRRKKGPVKKKAKLSFPVERRSQTSHTEVSIIPSLDPVPLIPFMKMNYRTCRSVEGHEVVNGHRLAMYCPNPKDPADSFCPYHQSIYYRVVSR